MVRLIKHMKAGGASRVTPEVDKAMPKRAWVDFQAGYLTRVIDELPKQGDRDPWQNQQNYKHDQKSMLKDPIDDGALIFSSLERQLDAAE